MMWNIIVLSDECDAHPDFRKNWDKLCYLTVDGKCTYENCPRRNKGYEIMKALEKMQEILSRGNDPYDD